MCVLDMALYKALYILCHCDRLLYRMFVIAVCQCLNNKVILIIIIMPSTFVYAIYGLLHTFKELLTLCGYTVGKGARQATRPFMAIR